VSRQDSPSTYEIDEEAERRGVLRLRLLVDAAGERVRLLVTFPDLYPYFRFEVEAPDLSLPYHQHPFGKNLCLIGRGTHDWSTTDTVADVLGEKLGDVLRTGRSADREAARGVEQRQAEPFGEYYPYAESMIVLGGVPPLPPEYDRGTFRVATAGPQGPPTSGVLVRGVLAELSADGGVFWQEDPAKLTAWAAEPLRGRWLRAESPIAQDNAERFLSEMLRRHPFAANAPANHVSGGWLQVWGVVFPEEHRWRDVGGDGWVFFCLFSPERRGLVGAGPPLRPRRGEGIPRKRDKTKRNR